MLKKYSLLLKKNRRARSVLIALSLSLLALVFIWAIYSNFGSLLAKSTPFPVQMHSVKQADYSKDPAFLQIAPVELQLVIDAIWDDNPAAQSLAMRLTQVNENFFSIIASVTPQLSATTPSSTTDGPAATATGLSPSASSTLSFISTSPGPTGTILPLTNTFIPGMPTNTESPGTPSSTPHQPPFTFTFTPPPTYTSAPPPTKTYTQPVPTNTTSPCGSLSLTNFSTDLKKVTVRINNGSPTLISISQINLTWPVGNDSLDKIFLGTSKIWDQTAPPPSIVINSGWTSGARNIGANTNSTLKYTFGSQVVSSGYNIGVKFTNGCSVSTSN